MTRLLFRMPQMSQRGLRHPVADGLAPAHSQANMSGTSEVPGMAWGRYGAAANLFCRMALGNARPQRKQTSQQRLAMLPLKGAPVSRPVSIFWDDHQIPFVE